ncbi:MAG TPA: amidohydrolase family protein [Candidatus Binatia bacterium]|nr:amidohydrolase family protein [Candidatus Binatia bacterium]
MRFKYLERRFSLKQKYFDCHFHIIDKNFPVVANQGFMPDAFTSEDYLTRVKDIDLCGGAVVSGSFQELDQSYLFHALKVLGPTFVGVTQVPQTISDAELQGLNDAGVRAVRFNVKRGGSEDIKHLESFARRVHKLVGWHTELYIDSTDAAGLFDTLVSLPAVSIDHIGLSKAGFPTLLKLAEKGVRVKATGFGRVDFDVGPALKELYAANPKALMFGTDLPSTRAPRPYLDSDYTLVLETLGEEKAANVFYKNAVEFYRPKQKLN